MAAVDGTCIHLPALSRNIVSRLWKVASAAAASSARVNGPLASGAHVYTQHIQVPAMLVYDHFGQAYDSELGNADNRTVSFQLRIRTHVLLQVEMTRR